MHCLRCGTEITAPAVFCKTCLEDSEQYPVSRETPVVLQPHPEYTPMRPRPVKPEELLAQANRRIKNSKKVIGGLVLLCLVLCVLVALAWELRHRGPAIGQNYTTAVTTAPTAPSETNPENTVPMFEAGQTRTRIR